MRFSDITDTGIIDRLRHRNSVSVPCPGCRKPALDLVTETLLVRNATGTRLEPSSASLACQHCNWRVDSRNFIYSSWLA